jgi:hypothetical protein
VDGAVNREVDGAVHRAVGGAVGGAVDGAVHGAVDGEVHRAVNREVDGAVDHAVDAAVGGVRESWFRFCSPWWAWDARSSFCIQHLGVAADYRDHEQAWRDASGAGWWWPHTQFTIVADRPTSIHRERIGPSGWGSHQLHHPTGPAIAWGDEWQLWFWHGINVPSWVVEAPTVEQINAEPNTEIRRCGIESYGWDRYLDHLGVVPVDVAADPANPGHMLELYDLPVAAQLYPEPVRLVVMSNASLDRDGSRRRFAETVPADIGDAVSAQAWAFDVDPDVYRALERAT